MHNLGTADGFQDKAYSNAMYDIIWHGMLLQPLRELLLL